MTYFGTKILTKLTFIQIKSEREYIKINKIKKNNYKQQK